MEAIQSQGSRTRVLEKGIFVFDRQSKASGRVPQINQRACISMFVTNVFVYEFQRFVLF